MSEHPVRSLLHRLKQPLSTVSVVAILIVATTITLSNMLTLHEIALDIDLAHEKLIAVGDLESALKDTETGQRGYILTGNPAYLEPYESANNTLDLLMSRLVAISGKRNASVDLLERLQQSVVTKRSELNRIIEIRDRLGMEAAREAISTDVGKEAMDEIRSICRGMRQLESKTLAALKEQSIKTYKAAWFTVLLSTAVGVGLVIGVLHAVHRSQITAERDAETIRDERQRLEKALNDRQLFERRSNQLDQHIRLFVDQIQDYAIFTINTDYQATSWNKGVSKVLGFEEEEFIGRDIRPMIFTPESNANGTTANEFKVATERGSASDDRWMMRKGQIRFWATGITSSIRDEHDQLIGFSKVMRDMTMQKQSSDELSRLASELSEESRRKNEFLATLAHELRNPLSPIKNAIQLMELMHLDGEINELTATMARQVEQMVRLIDDLLDISRIGRGKLELKRESVQIETIVNAAVESSLPLIQANKQELEVVIENRGVVVFMDSGRMTQVLCNLLNNSSKYSPANCKIRLSAKQENDNIQFRIQDNGNGIAPARIETIFDIFSQLGDSVERGVAGLGIGLALVRTIVELHGGTVVAVSEGEGLGSEFTISIPNASPLDSMNSKEFSSVPNISNRFYRVLVVEDMRALAVVLARLLSKMGHHVEMVENGEAAIEKLKTFDAEVVFSDISMPMMTGYELARYLRSHKPESKMKLVAMTGYGQLSDREKAFAAGFDEHMTKPVDINRLREFFNRLSDAIVNDE